MLKGLVGKQEATLATLEVLWQEFQDNGEYTFEKKDPLTFLQFFSSVVQVQGESRTTCFNPSLTAIQNHSEWLAGYLSTARMRSSSLLYTSVFSQDPVPHRGSPKCTERRQPD